MTLIRLEKCLRNLLTYRRLPIAKNLPCNSWLTQLLLFAAWLSSASFIFYLPLYCRFLYTCNNNIHSSAANSRLYFILK